MSGSWKNLAVLFTQVDSRACSDKEKAPEGRLFFQRSGNNYSCDSARVAAAFAGGGEDAFALLEAGFFTGIFFTAAFFITGAGATAFFATAFLPAAGLAAATGAFVADAFAAGAFAAVFLAVGCLTGSGAITAACFAMPFLATFLPPDAGLAGAAATGFFAAALAGAATGVLFGLALAGAAAFTGALATTFFATIFFAAAFFAGAFLTAAFIAIGIAAEGRILVVESSVLTCKTPC